MGGPGPSPLLKIAFRGPELLYRLGLGWVLGRRFLLVTHRGRKTGSIRQTVLEVISYDRSTRESVVVSAYGPRADWYQNVRAEPALRVRTGRLDYRPEQRFLDDEGRQQVAIEFARRHPWEIKLISRMFPAIGAGDPGVMSSVEALGSLPMVAFRPRG